jgi:prepilin-type processing-associated H-X9-DG protein
VSIYHAKNKAPTAVNIRVLSCPSSPAWGSAVSHYAGVHNDAEKPIDAKDNGVFFLNSKVRYDDVTDGSTHTIFIGEKIPDAWDFFWASGTRGTLRNAGLGVNALTFNTGLPRPGDSTDEIKLPPDTIPQLDDVEKPDDSALPAAPAANVGPVMPGNPLWVGGFGSSHPGGALFAFGDGHVRLMGGITPQMAHRNDGKLPAGN